jgi:hypothetical protein
MALPFFCLRAGAREKIQRRGAEVEAQSAQKEAEAKAPS